jgi:molecular chaperone GrpE
MTSARRPAAGAAGRPGEFVPPTGNKSTEGAEADSAAAVDADLDALLADTERQRDEYLELAQRTKADFENYRKRAARDTQEAERRAKSALASELLPALDSLERALLASGVGESSADSEADEPRSREVSAQEALAEGVQLVLRELRDTLARAGVQAFDPTGERFDPAWHEALATRPAKDESGVVLETLEKGYRLDGQLIRPARVVVAD